MTLLSFFNCILKYLNLTVHRDPIKMHPFCLGLYFRHTPDTLRTVPDIAANARPMRAWLNCRTITTHAHESLPDLSRNCKGLRARESEHARVTESRAHGTGVGRDIRQSPSRVRSVFLLIYDFRNWLIKMKNCFIITINRLLSSIGEILSKIRQGVLEKSRIL